MKSSVALSAGRVGIAAHLSAEDLEALLDGLEVLGASIAGLAAEDELGVELPAVGDAPLAGDLGVDERVVVLQVGAEALGRQGRPDYVLEHGVRLQRPDGELVAVQGVLFLHRVDDVLVLEEENLFRMSVIGIHTSILLVYWWDYRGAYGAGARLEHVHAVGGVLPGIGGHDGLKDLASKVPELVVLGAEEDDDAVGLGVEGGGDVEDGLLDDLLDALLGDG